MSWFVVHGGNSLLLINDIDKFLKICISSQKIILTAKSPDIFAPAKIPVAAGKNTENTEKNV